MIVDGLWVSLRGTIRVVELNQRLNRVGVGVNQTVTMYLSELLDGFSCPVNPTFHVTYSSSIRFEFDLSGNRTTKTTPYLLLCSCNNYIFVMVGQVKYTYIIFMVYMSLFQESIVDSRLKVEIKRWQHRLNQIVTLNQSYLAISKLIRFIYYFYV